MTSCPLTGPLNDARYAQVFRDFPELGAYIKGLERNNSELVNKTNIDGLTGLFNHDYFKKELGKAVSFSRREISKGLYLPVCVGMGDIDSLKKYNDTFGHPAGDEALEVVALAVVEALRDYDIPCRYGGDEVGLILPGTDLSDGLKAIERVRNRVYESSTKNLRIPITMTFGVAEYPFDGNTAERLIQSADRALYHAKRTGRNRVFAARDLYAMAE